MVLSVVKLNRNMEKIYSLRELYSAILVSVQAKTKNRASKVNLFLILTGFFMSLWPGLVWDRIHTLSSRYTAVLYIQCEDNFDSTLMFLLLLTNA